VSLEPQIAQIVKIAEDNDANGGATDSEVGPDKGQGEAVPAARAAPTGWITPQRLLKDAGAREQCSASKKVPFIACHRDR